ncbi:hypothetical protein MACH17_24580 [Phaeobacter inhibens]|uniref:hypothetical protein n=1 Tax=Phaeobacter inhibens TaxID=221822 RepID=UPI000C9B3E78|nr:hypothetical protein [Phaeobacter inhibens]AUQ53827.1 hypothetical protein PhaeoP92_01139 [Phaeobacter inhibens]AUQ77843.1 hypothetical protein PhaeoP74_01140 [Phaeobacter inhibens]AUR15002.1 hypothetical protein PhaeoP70_01138 [Phaeobacter inhibens]GLO70941.1 hypothetical protein MACH17_24580 [Phaeobacter inhibens]
MRVRPHPKARPTVSVIKADAKVPVAPALATAGAGSWLPIGIVVAVALLAGCAGPGRYPLSGQTVGMSDPVLSLSMTQGATVAGGL